MWIITTGDGQGGADGSNLVIFKPTGDQMWVRANLKHAFPTDRGEPFTDLVQAIDAADKQAHTD
jgi:hypothetical protein